MSVKVEIIRDFKRYTPTTIGGVKEVEVSNSDGITVYASIQDGAMPLSHFPIIIDKGVPWLHANEYLVQRMEDQPNLLSKTFVGIARDLAAFKCWVNEQDVDYLVCLKTIRSPIRKYRNYLSNGVFSPTVISRKMSRLVEFYRWLQSSKGIDFYAPLWKEKKGKIILSNDMGMSFVKTIRTTDVQSVKGKKQDYNNYDGIIKDGGNLKPLDIIEQKILFEELKNIGNVEMTLAFMVAIATGARIQTIFTLRKAHFLKEIKSDEKEIVVYVGAWGDGKEETRYANCSDTKNNKRLKIIFPSWLYERMRVYMASPRANIRYDKARHIFQEKDLQYFFLTSRGNPFYCSRRDTYISKYLYPPEGGSVRTFILNQLTPAIRGAGFNRHFQFHDLRASFGMNLVRLHLPFVGMKGHLSIGQIFQLVRVKMGHSRLSTTEQYLTFDEKQGISKQIQIGYEEYLQGLLNWAEKDAGNEK